MAHCIPAPPPLPELTLRACAWWVLARDVLAVACHDAACAVHASPLQTTCSFIAVNPPNDVDPTVPSNEPPYTGSCKVTAVAKCCKQLCKEKHKKHHWHPPPKHKSYGYGYGGYGGHHGGYKQYGYTSGHADAKTQKQKQKQKPLAAPRPPPAPPPPPARKKVQKRKAYMDSEDTIRHRRNVAH